MIFTTRTEDRPTTVRIHCATCEVCGHEERSTFAREDVERRIRVHYAVKHVETQAMKYASDSGWRNRTLYHAPDEETLRAIVARVASGNSGDTVEGAFTKPGWYVEQVTKERYDEGNGGVACTRRLVPVDRFTKNLEEQAANLLAQARDIRAVTKEG